MEDFQGNAVVNYTSWDQPYYPVNDAENGALYAEYNKLADAESNVIFGGRLGQYRYYDMDKIIRAALDDLKAIL